MFENWTSADFFVTGFAIGYVWYPFWQLIKLIIKNAWEATHSCSGDCRQGRLPCNCQKKSR